MPDVMIDEGRVGHIFRDAVGHFHEDTPANRRALVEAASRESNFLGTDRFGNDWFAELRVDGTQIWTRVRGGKITNGGITDRRETWFLPTYRRFVERVAPMRKQRLSLEQAFAAMVLYLERYHSRGSSDGDDLAALLGDIQINERDGLPLDPAAWTDWLSAVEDVLEREHLAAAQK